MDFLQHTDFDFVNEFPTTAADILLKVRTTLFGCPPGDEVHISLQARMDSLLASGYELDDLLGLTVPLLMEGKVRLDLDGGGMERMEMVSQLRLARPAAIAIFEKYASKKKDDTQVIRKPHANTVLISIPKKR